MFGIRHLGVKLVIEGIETAEQGIILQAQGFHFSRPLDAVSAEAFLTQHISDREAR